MKKALLILVLAAMSVCLFGCNTLAGFGGDMKWTGEQIQSGAGQFTQ